MTPDPQSSVLTLGPSGLMSCYIHKNTNEEYDTQLVVTIDTLNFVESRFANIQFVKTRIAKAHRETLDFRLNKNFGGLGGIPYKRDGGACPKTEGPKTGAFALPFQVLSQKDSVT